MSAPSDADASDSTITASLSRFIASSPQLDEPTRELARLHVLDALASMVACRDLVPAEVGRRYAIVNSGSGGRVSILGTTERVSLVDAVFASAMAGHAAEINTFTPSVFVQPGPAIVSAVMGLCEARALSGEAAVLAVVIGFELATRIPRAIGSENLRRAGLASHGVGSLFGAAAAASSLLALPEDRIGDVLTCSAQQASGSWQWLYDVEHIEKAFVFAGMGARSGLQAALLVEVGFRGVPSAFDHRGGWLWSDPFAGGDRDHDVLTTGFDRLTALDESGFKRYPAGGPTQPAIAALLELVDEIDPAEVVRVAIQMPGRADAFRDAAMPALNLRYLTAIILLDGRLDFVAAQSLDRMRHDARVAELMAKVDVSHDPAQETGGGRDRAESARVVVTTATGMRRERFVASVPGFPTHPMSSSDVESKARALMTPHLGRQRSDEVVSCCAELDRLENVAELIPLIAR